MKKINFCLMLVFVILVLSITNCKKENQCDSTINAANFKIYEALDENIRYIDIPNGDTVRTGIITFEALQSEGVEYEWHIGSDPRVFRNRTFRLEFPDNQTAVSVTLIVKKVADNGCFLHEDGADTLTKSFVAMDESLVEGDFYGSLESNVTEKFTLSTLIQPRLGYSFVYNLPNGCTRDYKDAHELSYFAGRRTIKFGHPEIIRTGSASDVYCQIPWGFGKILEDNQTLVLDYEMWNPTQKKFIKDRFIGIRK
ncbi:MAG: hypothetical protein RLZZ628_509 [Bacteroidota bacterium]|jgi:hypothetical protein